MSLAGSRPLNLTSVLAHYLYSVQPATARDSSSRSLVRLTAQATMLGRTGKQNASDGGQIQMAKKTRGTRMAAAKKRAAKAPGGKGLIKKRKVGKKIMKT